MVSAPSAVSVQVKPSDSVFVHVTALVSSALAEISHRMFYRVSFGKYVSVAAAMTIADERAASHFHCFMIICLLLFQLCCTFVIVLLYHNQHTVVKKKAKLIRIFLKGMVKYYQLKIASS